MQINLLLATEVTCFEYLMMQLKETMFITIKLQ